MKIKCSHAHSAAFRTTDKEFAILPDKNGVIKWHLVEGTITKDLDKHVIIEEFKKAFDEWAPHFAPIRFEPTNNMAEAPITINFAKNGDRHLPERFGSTTLAYAFFPDMESLGIHSDMYFNDIYDWAVQDQPNIENDINLKAVVVHELGHAFGIDHTTFPDDIMQAFYSGDNVIIITQDSICLLYTSPSPRDRQKSRMPSSA